MKSPLDAFYGLSIDAKTLSAITESLIAKKGSDLVDRHLVANGAYFGAIDKTLSGFVVLDDEGDDYTLADVRDSGQVFFQDHDERIVDLRFDSVDDYLGFRRELKEAGPEADRDEILDGWLVAKAKHRKKPSTSELLDRYQWLVWLLAQPLVDRGKPMQTTSDLAQTAMNLFGGIFESRSAAHRLFDKEFPSVTGDPHLAIYWLLHTTMVGDDERRARLVAKLAKVRTPLLTAFVDRVGRLEAGGDLPVVPDFRTRRAMFTIFAALDPKKGRPDPVYALRALASAPDFMLAARSVVASLESGALTDADVAHALDHVRSPSLASSLVLAVLDRRAGKARSPHADRVIAVASKAEWSEAVDAVKTITSSRRTRRRSSAWSCDSSTVTRSMRRCCESWPRFVSAPRSPSSEAPRRSPNDSPSPKKRPPCSPPSRAVTPRSRRRSRAFRNDLRRHDEPPPSVQG